MITYHFNCKKHRIIGSDSLNKRYILRPFTGFECPILPVFLVDMYLKLNLNLVYPVCGL